MLNASVVGWISCSPSLAFPDILCSFSDMSIKVVVQQDRKWAPPQMGWVRPSCFLKSFKRKPGLYHPLQGASQANQVMECMPTSWCSTLPPPPLYCSVGPRPDSTAATLKPVTASYLILSPSRLSPSFQKQASEMKNMCSRSLGRTSLQG